MNTTIGIRPDIPSLLGEILPAPAPAAATTLAVPDLDIEPRPGQSDAGIEAWRKVNFPLGDPKRMFERRYTGVLMKTGPKERDWEAWEEWRATLTDRQREICETANVLKQADPKVIAANQKRAAKVKQDRLDRKKKGIPEPEHYQRQLDKQKADYAAKKDAPVRPYDSTRCIKIMTAAEKKVYQAERTARLNEKIMTELAAGRNPYPLPNKGAFNSRDFNVETILARVARHYVCRELLTHGSIDPARPEVAQALRAFCQSLAGPHVVHQLDPTDQQSADALKKAVNGLRAAGVTRRSGGHVHLHKKIEAERQVSELEIMKGHPGFGVF